MFQKYRPEYPHFNQVVEQCVKLSHDHNIYDSSVNRDGQLSFQTNSDIEDWRCGTGKIKSRDRDWEKQFNKLQPSLVGTPIDNYLNWLGVTVYRTRLLLCKPRVCYTIHNDYSPRLHLPLVTNKNCLFLFTEMEKVIHMPASGETFWVDTRLNHTFLNGSTENRLHLVMIVDN
jgi:hypothetical protein